MLQRIHPLIVVAVLLTAASALAADPVAIVADGEPLFADYDPDAKADANVSGAVCFDDGSCLLVADEMIAIQRIKLDIDGVPPSFRTGRTYGLFFGERCKDIRRSKTCKEVDLEAIARDGADIYVAGSMGNRSRSGKRAKDRWFLARFSVTKSGRPRKGSLLVQSKRPLLKQMFNAHPALEPFLELPLQCGGMNIEGMAVLEDQLFFGLRSPADLEKGQAYIVQAGDEILIAERKSDVGPTTLHTLTFRAANGKPIRNIGIRAIEPVGKRLLIATGDAGVSAPTGNSRLKDIKQRCKAVPGGANLPNVEAKTLLVPRIWIWDPGSGDDPVEVARLDGRYADEKLEGMAVLGTPAPSSNKADLLLTIDGQNDVPALALLKGVRLPD